MSAVEAVVQRQGRGRRKGEPQREKFTLDEARTTGAVQIFMACRMAMAYPTRCPTVDELMHRFGMSRACAYRWRRGWLDAHGVEA